jgi:hypothetical protein
MDGFFHAVAARLVEESVFDAVTERGAVVELWVIRPTPTGLEASAPAGDVALGMRLGARVIMGGVPHRVVIVVDHVAPRGHGRAGAELRLVHVMPDLSDRSSERTRLSLVGTVTTLHGEHLPAGAADEVTVTDLSRSGFRCTAGETRFRCGDTVNLHCRVVEGAIGADARVIRTESARLGGIHVGCEFLTMPPESRWALHGTLRRLS